MGQTTALALAPTQTIATPAALAFEPADWEAAIRFAKIAVASRLLPKSVATPEAACIIIATGRELGMTAMQSLRSIHVIEGKPTMSADLMVALVKRSPSCEMFRLVESTPTVATYSTSRRGEGETRMSFTMAEAQAAGVTGKDNWKKYPAAMLRARAASALCRAVYPDVLLSVYETDEIQSSASVPEYVTEPVRYVEAEPIARNDFDAIAKKVGDPADIIENRAAATLESRIAGADTLDALGVVAEEIKRADIGDDARGALRKLYRARKSAIESAREPGSEG